MTLADKLAPYMTLESAKEWQATSEKWTYVTEILDTADVSYSDDTGARAESMVRYVENKFMAMLSEASA